MIFPFLTAALVSFLITPIVVKYAKALGIVDDPETNKHPKVIHTKPTPRGGGIPIFVSLFATSLIFLPLDKHLISILAGALVLVIMGFLDDKYNLNPYLRLFFGFLAAAIPVLGGIGVSFLTNPLGGTINFSPIISDLFAMFWVVFLMNMVNMGAKGVDGQLSGVTIISALTIAALSLRFSADIAQWPVIILAVVTAGAYSGFLPWHIFPQKIMPGYGGGTLAGYLLAILSILSTTKVGTLMVVLGVPLIDTGYTIIRRVLSGHSPVWGDRGHLHHRLLDAGLTKNQVAILYWLITAVLGILALNLNTTSKLYTMIGVGMFVGGIILWLSRKQ
ncbi:MAG: Glycosyltransferase, group 4 family [Candidatus Woesebacteria bacterium GW2011_GWB1_41_10]|uniref:Glycosyltransferase, group 4 family n=1 Tax=Candidatus Woesebacteria bacterium GW2011_GWB1_41_10 TaxID=1618577 RepID=A0A0G0UGH8_9BACT|nr:MAG: Glycosyltransferase, group 4 family [Candidatus Woesebacteria bacterium GW2011_GWB1_41_10]